MIGSSDHARRPAGPGWWGPDVGGSDVYSTSVSVAEDVHEVGRVERLAGDRPAGAVAVVARRSPPSSDRDGERRSPGAGDGAAGREVRHRCIVADPVRTPWRVHCRRCPGRSSNAASPRSARACKQLREELAVSDEQLGHLAEAADDARLRSLVSETPLADREHHDAQRHADAMQRHRAEVLDQISRLEQTQDELLDRLMAETRS